MRELRELLPLERVLLLERLLPERLAFERLLLPPPERLPPPEDLRLLEPPPLLLRAVLAPRELVPRELLDVLRELLDALREPPPDDFLEPPPLEALPPLRPAAARFAELDEEELLPPLRRAPPPEALPPLRPAGARLADVELLLLFDDFDDDLPEDDLPDDFDDDLAGDFLLLLFADDLLELLFEPPFFALFALFFAAMRGSPIQKFSGGEPYFLIRERRCNAQPGVRVAQKTM